MKRVTGFRKVGIHGSLSRRQMLLRTGAAAVACGLAGWPSTLLAQSKPRKVLFFSKSSGFEHSVIKRAGGQASFAERLLAQIGPRHGVEFVFSKDGSLFSSDYLAGFDALAFYTTGDLTKSGTDGNPPMTAAGKAALLESIRAGKGFVGIHSATDTFHTPEPQKAADGAKPEVEPYRNDGEKTDPYIKMIGAEFITHGKKQQRATLRVVDREFTGMPKSDLSLLEEWYSFKNFASDLHVLLVQETKDMQENPYKRPPYPATWARKEGRGRVFYTSMGHREDVWLNPDFEQVLFGGIAWASGVAEAEVPSNIEQSTPGYASLPPR